VSLHVVPRPSATSILEDDEERTTLDEGELRQKALAEWEDGTTVEESTLAQGKAFRDHNPFSPNANGNTTNTTSTSGQTLDELTVEEHARPLPPLQLVPPAEPAQAAASTAKMIVIAGTDSGREFDMCAGKPLTIGRAVDNDFVLTDISVSRKHFDLIYEGERWVLRDRGSGNGTLINDRMEDASCQLHHGDRIEIGNTAFRFDHPSSMVAISPVGWGQRDDEDARTVAGKPPTARDDLPPINGGPISRPVSTLPGPPASARRDSQKSQPPLARARTNTGPGQQSSLARGGATPGLPPVPPGMTASGPHGLPIGVGGVPVYPAMPVAGPNAQTMAPFVPQGQVPVPDPIRLGLSQPVLADYPSATPAELAAVGRYPSSGQMSAMRQSGPSIQPPAPSPSPMPMMAVPPARSASRWALIGGVAVVVASIGVTAAALGGSAATPAPAQITPPNLPRLSGLASTAGAPDDPETTPDPVRVEVVPTADSTVEPVKVATTDTTQPTTRDPVATDPVAPDKAAAEKLAADKLAADKLAADKAAAEKLAADKAAADARKTQSTADKRAADQRKADEAREARRLASERRAEEKRLAAEKRAADKRARDERNRDNDGGGTRTAALDAEAIEKAENKASAQYQTSDFRGAAATLFAAANGAEAGVADDLRSKASNYKAIQDGLNAGKNGSAAKAPDTLVKLKKALEADKRAGGVHAGTIRDQMASIAPSAAVTHMANGNYEAAYRATVDAVNVGAGGQASVKNVRKALEGEAIKAFQAGNKLLASDPTAAKQQFSKVFKLVPKDSLWYVKAQKAIAKAG
jgi:hypothetical protein